MRRINDDENEKLEKLLNTTYRREKVRIVIGETPIEIPQSFLDRARKTYKLWEASSIQDVKDNYEMLTETGKIPLLNRLWMIKTVIPIIRKDKSIRHWVKDMQYDQEALKSLTGNEGKWSANTNLVSLDNVYLGDFRFIRRKSFEACDMEIRDKEHNSIRGTLIYKHKMVKDEEDQKMVELSKVLSYKEFSTNFDIFFNTLSEKYMMDPGVARDLNPANDGLEGWGRIPNYTPFRGKRLMIHSIRKDGKELNDPININVGGFVPSYS